MNQQKKAVEIHAERELSDLEKQGLIHAFDFTHELAWNDMKDFFSFQGNTTISGSRDATRDALKSGIIDNGEIRMDMIKSSNRSFNTCNEEIAEEIVKQISGSYLTLFRKFRKEMEGRLNY